MVHKSGTSLPARSRDAGRGERRPGTGCGRAERSRKMEPPLLGAAPRNGSRRPYSGPRADRPPSSEPLDYGLRTRRLRRARRSTTPAREGIISQSQDIRLDPMMAAGPDQEQWQALDQGTRADNKAYMTQRLGHISLGMLSAIAKTRTGPRTEPSSNGIAHCAVPSNNRLHRNPQQLPMCRTPHPHKPLIRFQRLRVLRLFFPS